MSGKEVDEKPGVLDYIFAFILLVFISVILIARAAAPTFILVAVTTLCVSLITSTEWNLWIVLICWVVCIFVKAIIDGITK